MGSEKYIKHWDFIDLAMADGVASILRTRSTPNVCHEIDTEEGAPCQLLSATPASISKRFPAAFALSQE
jgi:hypothetical protein